ncbi:BRO family protein [Pseudomonas alkylphenolica]|uniref:BRO-N domain-containing protein n=1 Tax=Pseudomonas alkylphenolica TaxID=237609 RepID=UPI003391C436
MSHPTHHTFEEKNLRVLMIKGDPWFVAIDVSAALLYSEASAMTRHLDDDEKGLSILQTPVRLWGYTLQQGAALEEISA